MGYKNCNDWVLIYFPAKCLVDSEHFYSRMGSNAVSKNDTNVIATKHHSFLQNIADRDDRQIKYLWINMLLTKWIE